MSHSYPLDITFTSPNGAQVKLVGYDVLPDPQWRSTAFRFYWQPLTPLPKGVNLRAFFLTPDGREVDSTDQRPLIQPLWYPSDAWQIGETVVTGKLAWYLPKQWAPAVGVYEGTTWDDTARRWRISAATGTAGVFDNATWALLDGWQWDKGELEPLPAPQASPANAVFAGDGWTTQLTGVSEPERAAPGQRVPLTLQWQALGPARATTRSSSICATPPATPSPNPNSTPTWFGPQPTTAWQAGQTIWSAHSLELPANLPPGVYDLVTGWYYWETLERLAVLGPDGQPNGDSAPIGRIEVDTTAAPNPDIVCAIIPETCASQ